MKFILLHVYYVRGRRKSEFAIDYINVNNIVLIQDSNTPDCKSDIQVFDGKEVHWYSCQETPAEIISKIKFL